MIKDIKYSGYSAVPSDYECPDGELGVALNLINEDGAMSGIGQPTLEIDCGGVKRFDEVLYIHKTSAFKHYITYTDGAVSWFEQIGDNITLPQSLKSIAKDDVRQITSVGNTLIILAPDGIHYFLWKGDDAAYLYLGTHLPECPLSFGLQGEFIGSESFTINFERITWESEFCNPFSDSNKESITSQVLAKVNKFIAEESTSKGKFIFPFFVRYAYRLYDGTLTMHSAPILMTASTDITPEAAILHVGGSKSDRAENCDITLYMVRQTLDYAVIHASRIEELKKWGDIISSIDIFVSKPIYTYDQNGKCTRFENAQTSDTYGVFKLTNQTASTTTYPKRYQRHKMHNVYALHTNNFETIYRYRVALPKKSQDAIKEEIRNTSQFYFLESIKIDNLKTERTPITVKEDYLETLVTREVMSDDYDSHDILIAESAYVYNNRLNISNVKKRLYDLYNTAGMMQFTDGYVGFWSDMSPTYFDTTGGYTVYFHIKQDGKELIVGGESGILAGAYYHPLTFLFYPNINAFKATIVTWYGLPTVYEVPLEKHGLLNGAFYFKGWENPSQGGEYRSYASPAIVDLPNKVYTSEVNNPFFFPVTGINTVGTGKILAIATAAKALSQGQFGQFPLYAFTDEGVWAMEVSSTGTYSAKQPITRDVCTNPAGITQIDSSVLFPTDRGIMLISGSQTQCISDTINTDTPFDIMALPGMKELHTKLGHIDTDTHPDKCLPIAPFNLFLKECGMLYDYVHQRIIVFNKSYTYAYVYSLKTKLWGMMYANIKSGINSYPEALAVDADGNLVNFSANNSEHIGGLLVTRPLKLETPDILKTMDTVIQRGFFKKGHVQSVLYGSRDLINWHLVWSSKDHYLRGFRGTPYKYFRIALLCNLDADESIFGASLQFTPRQTNQPR